MERRTGGGRGAGEQAIFPASTPPFPLKKMKREIVETIGAAAVAAAAADLILSSVPSRRSVPVSMFKYRYGLTTRGAFQTSPVIGLHALIS